MSRWKRWGIGAKTGASMAAGVFTPFMVFFCLVYRDDFLPHIPADKALSLGGLILFGVISIAVFATYWAFVGIRIASLDADSHPAFTGTCWGLFGASIVVLGLVGKGALEAFAESTSPLTPALAWIMGLMLIVLLLLIVLSGLFGWVVGDRIADRLRKAETSTL